MKIAILESNRANEFRIPIHPKHFSALTVHPTTIFFQNDYAANFRAKYGKFPSNFFGYDSRDELLKSADLVFLLKPTKTDLEKMKEGATLIGWCHAIQQIAIAKIAIQRKLTLIAMESMYDSSDSSYYHRHLFHENNHITGFEGVVHALSFSPLHYPRSSKISVIGYGNVSHGAVSKLIELGYENITVYIRRSREAISGKLPNIEYHTVTIQDDVLLDNTGNLLKDVLKKSDIIINGIKQDPINPYYFLSTSDLKSINGVLIIDLSCDDNMGFEFSHETTWETPVVSMYNNYYYAIPNIPSIVWDVASEHISEGLLPIVNGFLSNNLTNTQQEMLNFATEIKTGIILNMNIIEYQKKLGFW